MLFLLIAVQNDTISVSNIKVKIDNNKQNIKCLSCGDRDETVNNLTNEYSKLAQSDFKSRKSNYARD